MKTIYFFSKKEQLEKSMLANCITINNSNNEIYDQIYDWCIKKIENRDRLINRFYNELRLVNQRKIIFGFSIIKKYGLFCNFPFKRFLESARSYPHYFISLYSYFFQLSVNGYIFKFCNFILSYP